MFLDRVKAEVKAHKDKAKKEKREEAKKEKEEQAKQEEEQASSSRGRSSRWARDALTLTPLWHRQQLSMELFGDLGEDDGVAR